MRRSLELWRRRTPLIWHARRNNEMIVGVLLRSLGWPLKLVFTSAAQRHHTWITRWLIGRMDAIIATNDMSHRISNARPPSFRTASIPTSTRRRRIARRRLRKRDCRAAMRSDVSAGCAHKRAPTYSWMRCADCCRAIPTLRPSSSAGSRPSSPVFANDLRQRIDAAGLPSRILITGELPIEEVQRWYQRLTIYAFTSRNEGFGLTLIEAMASGAALGGVARGRRRARGRGWRNRRADAARRCRCAGRRTGTADARSCVGGGDGRAGRGRGYWRNSALTPEANSIADVYRTLV